MSDKGSVLGCVLLIIGCCIGAGMLGMPVLTATAGFLPSLVAMVICCFFMIVTGLLLLEANLWFSENINLITLSRYALGNAGQWITWACFVFLFYCLCIAYAIACGDLLVPFLHNQLLGSVLSLSVVGILIYIGTRSVDYINRLLMMGLIIFYCLLVIGGASYIDKTNLLYKNWSATLVSVPLLLISFGYQNLIPSLTSYLRRDVKRIRAAIVIGTALTFLIYLVWEVIILGILPVQNIESIATVMDKGEMVTDQLQRISGIPFIYLFAQAFAFFAITTSLLANSLTCLEFLQDGLKYNNRLVLTLLVLLPPLIISQLYPNLFLKALSLAGGTATVILFGILPALIVWYGRYKEGKPHIVPGGKPILLFVIAFSCVVLGLEISRQLG